MTPASGGARLGALAVAFATSSAILCLPFPADVDGPFSRLAASALPWLALAGVPSSRAVERALPSAVAWSAAALVPLLVAARLDQIDGLSIEWVLAALFLAFSAVFLLALASARGAGGNVHAFLWSAFVPLPAVLGGVLALFAPEVNSAWAASMPLGAAWRAAAAPEAELDLFSRCAPLVVLIVLALVPGRATTERAA